MKIPKSFCYDLFYEKIFSQILSHESEMEVDVEKESNFPNTSVLSNFNKIENGNNKNANNLNTLNNLDEQNIIINCIRFPIKESEIQKILSVNELVNYSKINSSNKYISLKLSVIDISPSRPDEIILCYSDKEKKSYSLKDTLNAYNIKYYFNCCFKVRFSELEDTFFQVYLSTYDGEGSGFFGVSPGDCLSDYDLYSRTMLAINSLVGVGKYLELILQRVVSESGVVIFRIVGDYNNYNNIS